MIEGNSWLEMFHANIGLFRNTDGHRWQTTDLECDEDDEVGEVEAEDLAAGAGAAHHLQRGGKEGSLLGSGQGCNIIYRYIINKHKTF